MDEIAPYQSQLVERVQKVYPLSERIIEAFLRAPRHLFLSHYYLHQPGTRTWTRFEWEDTPKWYEQIYQDQALVTRVDEYGRTVSSSSQPSVMAHMLDALHILPGMRILEIGTGTGYNAALLATLTGDPRLVTTIDSDAEAIKSARCVLENVVGEGMTIVEGDGLNGYRANAPYDRIIVTASSRFLADTWIEQLAFGGQLICVLQPPFAMLGGMLVVQKQEKSLNGKIVGLASFMPIRDVDDVKRKIQVDFRASLITSFHFDSTLFQPLLLKENAHFAFFLYYDIPDLYVFQRPREAETIFSLDGAPQGYIVFKQLPSPSLELRGDRSSAYALWNRLLRVYSLWLHCGQPGITHYEFEMEQTTGKQFLFIATSTAKIWPFGSIKSFRSRQEISVRQLDEG